MAAEEIKGILSGREQVEQERILRWVNESLGLVVSAKRTEASGAPLATAPPSAATAGVEVVAQPMHPVTKDIKSFVGEKEPKNDVQFAAVAAYFYRFMASERKEAITSKDLDEAGRQARGYGFKKSLQTLNNARNLGYFDSAGRGRFKLNAVGENLVAMALPGTSRDKIGTRRGGRKNKRSNRRVNMRTTAKKRPGPASTGGVKRSKISAAGRARIAAAQKARWAKIKEAKGAPLPPS